MEKNFHCRDTRITECDVNDKHNSKPTAYILLYKLIVYDQTMEVGSWSTPSVPHFCLPIITSRGIGTDTCEVDNVFPPDDFWFGADTYINYTVNITCI